CQGVNSEKELEDYCVYHQRDDDLLIVIGTIFKEFERKLPASLDYKIRYGSGGYGDTFPTNMKYRVNGPHDDNQGVVSPKLSRILLTMFRKNKLKAAKRTSVPNLSGEKKLLNLNLGGEMRG
ncbi:hypothetical protein AVEN_164831-1, partial [Araneus ventricosus]